MPVAVCASECGRHGRQSGAVQHVSAYLIKHETASQSEPVTAPRDRRVLAEKRSIPLRQAHSAAILPTSLLLYCTLEMGAREIYQANGWN
jgi:hypothetical protein